MSGHTEGRLTTRKWGDGTDLERSDGGAVAQNIGTEDARRLAACWNFFPDHVPTEIIAEFSYDRQANTLTEWLAELNKVRGERDEARALLARFFEEYDTGDPKSLGYILTVEAVQKYLEKTK